MMALEVLYIRKTADDSTYHKKASMKFHSSLSFAHNTPFMIFYRSQPTPPLPRQTKFCMLSSNASGTLESNFCCPQDKKAVSKESCIERTKSGTFRQRRCAWQSQLRNSVEEFGT